MTCNCTVLTAHPHSLSCMNMTCCTDERTVNSLRSHEFMKALCSIHAAKRRMRVDFLQPPGLNRVQEVSRISTSFRETIRQTVFGTHVRKISNSSRACFLPQHLNHVNCFLLFRRVRGRSSGHEIVRVGANVNFSVQPAYILPQPPEHLAGSKTLHQSVEFSDCGAKGRSFDFSGLEED